MDGFLDRVWLRLRPRLRVLLQTLAPAGSWRQRVRFALTRVFRRWRLPSTRSVVASHSPEGTADPAAADRLFAWIDFHPHVLDVFPLATTPAQRSHFAGWLLAHRDRLGVSAEDIAAFGRECASDPSRGIDALYRRSIEWQRAASGDSLRSWLAKRYGHADWLNDAAMTHEKSDRPGVNLLANFCYPSGLQTAALNTRMALTQVGWNVSCRDVPNNARTDQPGRREFLGLHPYPVTIVQTSPEPLGKNAYLVAGLARRNSTRHVGYWYWELDSAPPTWARQRDWIQEVWAPTRFIAESFRRSLPMPIVEMPPGMPLPIPADLPRSAFGLQEDRFVFLFAFDMSSSGERKNPRAAVAAFRKAFGRSDSVTLALKVSRGWEEPVLLAELQAAAEPGRIVLIDRVMTRPETHALIQNCDAYVSLHRSEGFGLTLAEAMMLGKPTIATRYSGNLDFMNDANSLLVDCDVVPISTTIKWYGRGARWAEPSIDDAAEKMRWVVDHPSESRTLSKQGQRDVREMMSLEAAGNRMATRVVEIEREG